MGKLVSLDEYRECFTVRAIARRFIEDGHDPDAVRRTIAALLLKRPALSMVELRAAAAHSLGVVEHPRTHGPRLAKTGRAQHVTLRLIVGARSE